MENPMAPPSLKISQAAQAAGVSVQTLHYYERRGLIPRPARTGASVPAGIQA